MDRQLAEQLGWHAINQRALDIAYELMRLKADALCMGGMLDTTAATAAIHEIIEKNIRPHTVKLGICASDADLNLTAKSGQENA